MKKKEGKIFQNLVDPFFPKFKLKDMLQIIIGATILAVPIGFTQETWELGKRIPLVNVVGLIILSLIFITMFSFYQYHHHMPKRHHRELVKRVVSTYVLSFVVVSIILGLIQQTPWSTDAILAFKRVAIVTFPSSMSAAIADTLK